MEPKKSLLVRLSRMFFLTLLITSNSASGHGGVVLEGDLCVIEVGFYQAHFTIYQPDTSGHEEYCEDLPDLGESVFVLEYLHDGLEQLAVDFRIVRNTTGMGQFATWADIQALPDLDAVTEFYQPPVRKPDVFAILHEFSDPGAFIGIVTAQDAQDDTLYAAVFPFEVGLFGINYLAIAIAGVAATLASVFLLQWRRRRTREPLNKSHVLRLLTVLILPVIPHAYSSSESSTSSVTAKSLDGTFSVTATSRLDPILINTLHSWELELIDADGMPLSGADITITGGMPEHDHGLPTSPRVTDEHRPGVYTLDGMKFHMPGAWEVVVEVRTEHAADSATLRFEL